MKLLTLITLVTLTTACNLQTNAWWQNFKDDPSRTTEVILNSVETIERVATLAFAQLKPLIPQDKQTTYQGKFDTSILTLAKAVVATRSALEAAANLKEDHPDLTKVLNNVSKAVTDIQNLIAEIRKLVTPKVGAAPVAGTNIGPGTIDMASVDTLDKMVTDLQD